MSKCHIVVNHMSWLNYEAYKILWALYTVELQWLEICWLIHLGWLELSAWSQEVILCIIHPGWLELPLARTIFYGPQPVRAIEVLLYFINTSKASTVKSLYNKPCYNTDYLGHFVRKSVFGVCDKARLKPVSSATKIS